MWDMDLNVFSQLLNSAIAFVMLGLVSVGCTTVSSPQVRRTLELEQQWQVQPGDTISGHPVMGGLGDISLAVNGQEIYAPLDGKLQPYNANCVVFSSEELPIYLFRFCGLKSPKWGQKRSGDRLGKADMLNLAILNRRPNGKWAFVEPSKGIVEQILTPNFGQSLDR